MAGEAENSYFLLHSFSKLKFSIFADFDKLLEPLYVKYDHNMSRHDLLCSRGYIFDKFEKKSWKIQFLIKIFPFFSHFFFEIAKFRFLRFLGINCSQKFFFRKLWKISYLSIAVYRHIWKKIHVLVDCKRQFDSFWELTQGFIFCVQNK